MLLWVTKIAVCSNFHVHLSGEAFESTDVHLSDLLAALLLIPLQAIFPRLSHSAGVLSKKHLLSHLMDLHGTDKTSKEAVVVSRYATASGRGATMKGKGRGGGEEAGGKGRGAGDRE
jgi:hypothetical protein